jgi:hypothetical protein
MMDGKKRTISILIIIAIAAAGYCYWYWANIWKREIHWKPGPEIAFTPEDLTQVQWISEAEEHLGLPTKKKVIALAFGLDDYNIHIQRGPKEIITDPELIYRIINKLMKSDRIDGWRACGMFYLKIVYEDKSGMKIWINPDFDKHIIIGQTWESRDLYPIFENLIGPWDKQTPSTGHAGK